MEVKQNEIALQQQYQEQQLSLQTQAQQQRAALEQQSMQLTMEFQQKKAEEEMAKQQFDLERQQQELQMRMQNENSIPFQPGAFTAPTLPSFTLGGMENMMQPPTLMQQMQQPRPGMGMQQMQQPRPGMAGQPQMGGFGAQPQQQMQGAQQPQSGGAASISDAFGAVDGGSSGSDPFSAAEPAPAPAPAPAPKKSVKVCDRCMRGRDVRSSASSFSSCFVGALVASSRACVW